VINNSWGGSPWDSSCNYDSRYISSLEEEYDLYTLTYPALYVFASGNEGDCN